MPLAHTAGELHAPLAVVNQRTGKEIVLMDSPAGSTIRLSTEGSADPDVDPFRYEWFIYHEAGTYSGNVTLENADTRTATLILPADAAGKSLHVLLRVQDQGKPPLAAYRRVIVNCRAAP